MRRFDGLVIGRILGGLYITKTDNFRCLSVFVADVVLFFFVLKCFKSESCHILSYDNQDPVIIRLKAVINDLSHK